MKDSKHEFHKDHREISDVKWESIIEYTLDDYQFPYLIGKFKNYLILYDSNQKIIKKLNNIGGLKIIKNNSISFKLIKDKDGK